MSTVSLVEGSLFAERYRILQCIAAGGMGAVYEVIHVETNRRRALKVMHPHFLRSDELRDRFRQEARVAADIESEFIVDVFDAGVDEATQMPYLVMELLRGDELGKLLIERGHFTPVEVVTYLHQTALALDKTHRAHIVHRDLKPENLFLTYREDGAPRIKVLDFGIAKVVAESGTHVNATRSIGTPLYMAPEQFRPGYKVSPATDLHALAMVAYTLLVGKAYWNEEAQGSGGNVFAFASAVSQGPQELASQRARRVGVSLPPAFDVWFAKAVSFAPEDRFSTATSMVASLADALEVPQPGLGSGPQATVVLPLRAEVLGAPATTAPGLVVTKTSKPRRRRAIAVGMGVVVSVVALGAAGFLLRVRVRARQPQAVDPAGAPAEATVTVSAPAAAAVAPQAPSNAAAGEAPDAVPVTLADPTAPPADTAEVALPSQRAAAPAAPMPRRTPVPPRPAVDSSAPAAPKRSRHERD